MNTRKLPRAPSCPTNSSSDLGRNAASGSSGWRSGGVEGGGGRSNERAFIDIARLVYHSHDDEPGVVNAIENVMPSIDLASEVG